MKIKKTYTSPIADWIEFQEDEVLAGVSTVVNTDTAPFDYDDKNATEGAKKSVWVDDNTSSSSSKSTGIFN